MPTNFSLEYPVTSVAMELAKLIRFPSSIMRIPSSPISEIFWNFVMASLSFLSISFLSVMSMFKPW